MSKNIPNNRKNIFYFLDNYQNKSFSELAVTPLDLLILSQLSYLNFEKVVEQEATFTDLLLKMEELTIGNYSPKRNERLFTQVAQSKRFEGAKVCEVMTKLDQDSQFCAMCFQIQEHYFVIFRGTDMSVAGWKENFNMAIVDRIDAQQYALDYVLNCQAIEGKRFYMGGHSKGGNIALFAATKMTKELQEKMIGIYDFDGPGFKDPNFFTMPEYLEIASRVYRYVPQDDIVGVLLHHSAYVQVVKCQYFGAFQHDLFHWIVENDHFELESKTTYMSSVFESSICEWIESLDMDKKIELVEMIADIFQRAGITDLNQFKKHVIKSTLSLMSSYLDLSFEKKKILAKVIFSLSKYFVKYGFRLNESEEERMNEHVTKQSIGSGQKA